MPGYELNPTFLQVFAPFYGYKEKSSSTQNQSLTSYKFDA